MIGTAILSALGTAASAGMSIYNNAQERKRQAAEDARSIAYAEAKAAENPLSRSDNKALLAAYDREAKRQTEIAENKGKILGSTPEVAIAQQQAIAEGRGELMSGIAAGNAQRKDAWDARAEEARRQAASNQAAQAAQRNQSYAALAANAANLLGSALTDTQTGAAPKQNAPAVAQTAQKTGDPLMDGLINYVGTKPLAKANSSVASLSFRG